MSKPTFIYVSDLTGRKYRDFITMKTAEPDVCNDGLHYKCKRIDDDDGYNVVIV